MYQRLSYKMSEKAPGWPGNPTLKIEPYTRISKGDIVNESKVTMFNHFGSHMDGPKHFNDNGPRLGELPLERFIHHKPLLIDIPKTYCELIEVDDLRPFEGEIKEADLLMIRSGFSKMRVEQPEKYASEGPGVSSEASKYLMDNFPELKSIAMDWISLASFSNMEEGVLSHQYLLGKFHERYICIIEDLNFDGLDANKLQKVYSVPLFIEEIDSSPVTVIAELAD